MRRLFMTAVFAAGFGAIACGADGSPSYVPETPIAYDGRYLVGSFEQSPGNFWDVCPTRTPGSFTVVVNAGSDGRAYVLFESSDCYGLCQPTNPADSQVDLWLIAAPNLSGAMGLYFDTLMEGDGVHTGRLRFYGTGSACAQETLLADVPIDRLELVDAWSTRCVTVSGLAPYHGIGMAATGGTHRFRVDALRLGPPCHG